MSKERQFRRYHNYLRLIQILNPNSAGQSLIDDDYIMEEVTVIAEEPIVEEDSIMDDSSVDDEEGVTLRLYR